MSKITEMQMKIAELLQANEAAMTLVEQLTAERDAFAIRLEDSEEQYSELHNKNAALAAQVAELQQFCLTVAEVQEIRAEAGRDGFVKGYEYASYGSHPEDYADQYAEQIRQEVK